MTRNEPLSGVRGGVDRRWLRSGHLRQGQSVYEEGGYGNRGGSTREGQVGAKPPGASSLPMDSWSL